MMDMDSGEYAVVVPNALNSPQALQSDGPIVRSANLTTTGPSDGTGNSDEYSKMRYPRMQREISAGGDRVTAEHHDMILHKR